MHFGSIHYAALGLLVRALASLVLSFAFGQVAHAYASRECYQWHDA